MAVERREDLERRLLERLRPDEAEARDPEAPVDDVVYELSAEPLFEAVTEVAFREASYAGFATSGPPVGSVAASLWNEQRDEDTRTRLEVRLTKVGKDRYTVRLDERREKAVGERHWQDLGEERAPELELALIEFRDPAEASRIRQAADTAGQEAFDDAVDRGALVAPRCHCAP